MTHLKAIVFILFGLAVIVLVVQNNAALSTTVKFRMNPYFFQEKMTDLMRALEYVITYIEDLLIITKDTCNDHLNKVEEVLCRLQKAGLRVNVNKSSFALHEIEYLDYILTREGIKPQPKKVTAIQAL